MKRKSLFISAVLLLFGIFSSIFFLFPKKEYFPDKNQTHQSKKFKLPPVIEKYIDYLEAFLDSTQNVGAALTIVSRENIFAAKTFGVKKSGTNDSVDMHSVFRLASVSKGFSGLLACILENEGIFSLQDKIVTYLPEFRLKDSVNTVDLKIENILDHTSGLVPHAYDNLIEDDLPLYQIIKNLYEADISAPPGKLYSYQNVVFSLIDTIAYIQTGVPFDKLMEKYIFRPLRMKDASVGPHIYTRKYANIAFPHVRIDSAYCSIPPNLGYYNISPAAGINASISDMAKYLQALLGHNPEVLDSSILLKITTPLIDSPLKYRYTKYWERIDKKYYGLGWRIYMYKSRKIIYHGGYVKGYRAEIAFCPQENIGIAFLQNSPNQVASRCVPAFFDSYFHYLENDSTSVTGWNEVFRWFPLDPDSSEMY